MNELMEWLANYAFNHNIGYIFTHQLEADTPSSSDGQQRLVIINMEWKHKSEIPFSFAHEIGHILNGDKGINKFSAKTIGLKKEYRANLTGIDILLEYCDKHDLNFDSPIQFCERFGVPLQLDYLVNLRSDFNG